MQRQIEKIVIHCSATTPTMDIGANEIRSWHTAKGWRDIGYHFVVRLDGKIELGRMVSEVGAHVRGYNAKSIAICYVGGVDENRKPADTRTPEQKASLELLLRTCMRVWPGAEILGHRDFPGVTKACPSFDVRKWVADLDKKPRAQKKPINKPKRHEA